MTGEVIEIGLLILINAFSAFLIIVILADSLKIRLNLWLAGMTIALIGWVNSAYLGFAVKEPSDSVFFYRANDVFVAAFLLTAYLFYIVGFLQIRKRIVTIINLFINLSFIFLAILTPFTTDDVIQKEWGNEAVTGLVYPFFLLYAGILALAIIFLLILKYVTFSQDGKVKVRYFLIGTVVLVIFNIVFNVLSSLLFNTVKYQHIGDYSAVIFLAFTAFAMLRHKFLNIKITLTALLISIIGVLLIVDILALSHSLLEQGVKALMFAFFVVISILLVRSVLNEIRQREELARINSELDKSRKRYFDLASEQKDVIDVMGHEIRTPLTAIIQTLKVHKKYTLPFEKKLMAEAKSSKELTEALPLFFEAMKTIDRASTHASTLVTDMLETARLDKQRFELNYEKFDLVETVKSNVEIMSKTVEDGPQNVAQQSDQPLVKYQIHFEPPKFKEFIVEADKTRIGQAVYALLNNAIKYHDPAKKTVEVNISLTRKGNYAQITISDNGIGIDPADIHKLGKKFLRLNPKSSGNLQRPGGTGLGLFVVKGIMAYHKGYLQIESKGLTKGSTFTLQFPIIKKGTDNNKQE